MLRVCVLAVAALLMSGCSTLQMESPHLQVVNVGVVGASVLSQQLRVRVRVDNPNKVDLQVRGATCEVQLGGETFATGESERDFTVPALGSMEFDVDVTANAAAAVLRMLGSQGRSAQYRVVGKVHLAKGLVRTLPFEHKGELKLR